MAMLFITFLLNNVNSVIKSSCLIQWKKLESFQYSAALAVTGTWRGTSREKLYIELGWESLNSRRRSKRLTLFFKYLNNLSPGYTAGPIPPLLHSEYYRCDQDVIGGGG